MVDILKIVLHPAANVFIACDFPSEATYLSQSRQTRLHIVSAGVAGHPLLEETSVNKRMGTWSNQRHVSTYHVQQLWQFVNVCAPEKSSDPCHPPVRLRHLRQIIVVFHRRHCTKFDYAKYVFVEPVSFLGK